MIPTRSGSFVVSVAYFLFLKLHESLAEEWIVEDAVYISAESKFRSILDDFKLPRKCVKLRECYPIFFITTNKTNPGQLTSNNAGLISYILESTDTCEPEDTKNITSSPTSPGDTYVMCKLKHTVNESEDLDGRQKPLIIGVRPVNDELCSRPIVTAKPVRVKPSYHSGEEIYTRAERVVGGSELNPGEVPYVVAMTYRNKQVCGASVLDEFHVLTAAHCVSHLEATQLPNLRLLFGAHDIKDSDEIDYQERNVSKIIYHKEFSAEVLHDDVALVRLESPIDYNRKVTPVCLTDGSQPFEDGKTIGRLVGWGQTSASGEKSATPRFANLRIWKAEDCEEAYEEIPDAETFDTVFCAGGFQDGGTTDACRGDSGGPLTIMRNNKMEQVGIVSFGIGCGHFPAVFTKVESYRSWIDRHRTLIFDLY